MFIIKNRDNIPLFNTKSLDCIPDKSILLRMSKKNYKFEYNGKAISLKGIEKLLSENK